MPLDAEPSHWQTGRRSPEQHYQAAIVFAANANHGDDREEEDEREPDVDDEPSLGWTSTTNQTSADWQANHVWGAADLEQGVGPVRKMRAVSKTGESGEVLCGVLA